MKTNRAFLSILILSLLFISTSCDKEDIDNRPELPPVESLVMDFSDFQDNPADIKGLAVPGKGVAEAYVNFVHAYLNVSFWNAFTTGSLLLPVSSYAYALQQTPEYAGNDTWKWSYQFDIDVLELSYTATLTGKRIDNETFSMEMNIALTSLPAVKFTYFDGVCRYDHTHAEWNLYKNVNGTSVKTIEVEWDKDFVAGDASLRYTYVEPGQVETDSYILWEYTPGADYNAAYTISLATGMINIEWDTTTKAGRVKDPANFEDDAWHCWNDLLVDITCPD